MAELKLTSQPLYEIGDTVLFKRHYGLSITKIENLVFLNGSNDHPVYQTGAYDFEEGSSILGKLEGWEEPVEVPETFLYTQTDVDEAYQRGFADARNPIYRIDVPGAGSLPSTFGPIGGLGGTTIADLQLQPTQQEAQTAQTSASAQGGQLQAAVVDEQAKQEVPVGN